MIYEYDYGVNNQCKTHAVDAMQDVYTVGNFHSSIDLDPGADTAIFRTIFSSSGIFVSKLTQLAAGPLPLTWINVEGHLNDRLLQLANGSSLKTLKQE